MPGAVYGSVVYNDGTTRGRIDAKLDTAQSNQVRTTGLRLTVLDNNINKWVEFADAGPLVNFSALHPSTDRVPATSQAYYYYRLGMSMCILDNGNIIRVRVGNGTYADRQIWYQVVTDPTNTSQWASWSVLYGGTHYAVAVVPATASTYYVYSAKGDGIYKNNVKKQSITGIMAISPVQGQADAMFVTQVIADAWDHNRAMELKYSPNIETTAFADDRLNYRWNHTQISALKLSDGRVARVQVANFYADPRAQRFTESLTISFSPSTTSIEPPAPPTIIRGFLGQAGYNSITQPYLTKLSDGFYYLFYSENRLDASNDPMLSLSTLFWQRSWNLLYWSEPVAIGFQGMGATGIGVVQSGDYTYLANNGKVYRRLKTSSNLDISNYVSELSLTVPSEYQGGSGSFTVANPNGVNNALLDKADCEIKVEIGLRCSDGVYRYVQFGRWWISEVKQAIERKTNRISITLYDFWRRLENPLRDNYSFLGHTNFADWGTNTPNQLYNYYIRYCTGTRKYVSAYKYYYLELTNVKSTSFLLYTGWKGHNAAVSLRHRGKLRSGEAWGIVYRYQNDKNYYWARVYGTTLYITRVRNGTATNLTSVSVGAGAVDSTFTMVVIYRWGIHRVYIDGVLKKTYDEPTPGAAPGFVGSHATGVTSYAVDHLYMNDWQPDVTTDTLMRTILTMGDFHDSSIAAGTAAQLAVSWGPQTDLNTPAAALRQLAQQYKLDCAWRDNRISIGKFKENNTIFMTLANQVIETEVTEQVGRRINLAVVDGQEDSYIEIDGADTRKRGRQIVAYFDLPELKTWDVVRARAQEEVRRGVVGEKFNAKIPLRFDLWKMDAVTITDHNGLSRNLRIEGFTITIDQSTSPRQDMELELSALA